MSPLECDVLIIGGGIAGLSLASALAPFSSVVLVESEATLGYHTSSRSARQLIPGYGPQPVLELTRRTLELLDGVQSSTGLPLTVPRSFLLVGTEADVAAKANATMRQLTHAEALDLCPQLRPEAFEAAMIDTGCMGTDTDLLLEYHRGRASEDGVMILTGAPVTAAEYDGAHWSVRAGYRSIRAETVVNAAGAWADDVATLCAVAPQGLVPLRRTAAIVTAENAPPVGTPLVAAADDSFYYRPDPDGVLISPSEAEPAEPGDAQPHPGHVERLIKHLGSVTTLGITSVLRSWTGLRTQRGNGLPVVGPDPAHPGFFWLAGQGGYGFQTSSGIAELAAVLLTGADPADLGADPAAVAAAATALRPG
ncbi:FAD-dependent oxidoreductase [Arthrobacter sp. RIT-PI-e]|uniref:NAD(P)/FAD-dependent oxidoreductase n=1 Tax=Arthrobacter sp. RIT-PI-e TaxID=1681197 RepID=UPI0006764CE6|nr:FAD-dependent oxidoreductase [Arthrobacter sp. RIT-PI-e]KNC18186.1 FAD-dependent oxidoreductase [Arthrobacter sp. RIT-PI-e]